MIYEVYICYCCGYPIIFRYKPPQVFHLGTGWPCWEKQEKGECDSPSSIRIPTKTPRAKRERLLVRARRLYEEYQRKGDAAPILRFVKAQLDGKRGDVVVDLFVYLAGEGDKVSHRLVRLIVATAVWQEFFRHLKKKEDSAKRRKARREKEEKAKMRAKRKK